MDSSFSHSSYFNLEIDIIDYFLTILCLFDSFDDTVVFFDFMEIFGRYSFACSLMKRNISSEQLVDFS
jgi:hypothetical protein